MENIINQIIKIEEQAQAIMNDAEKLEESLDSDIEKEVSDIRINVEERVKTKYETIKRNESDYADRKIEEIKERYKKASERLDEVCKARKNEWVESIYKAVLDVK